MRRCSALGSGASTLPQQPLCRLPPRCSGPQLSGSPCSSPVPFGQVQFREPSNNSYPCQGTGVRGDGGREGRGDTGKNMDLEEHTFLALTMTAPGCS